MHIMKYYADFKKSDNVCIHIIEQVNVQKRLLSEKGFQNKIFTRAYKIVSSHAHNTVSVENNVRLNVREGHLLQGHEIGDGFYAFF